MTLILAPTLTLALALALALSLALSLALALALALSLSGKAVFEVSATTLGVELNDGDRLRFIATWRGPTKERVSAIYNVKIVSAHRRLRLHTSKVDYGRGRGRGRGRVRGKVRVHLYLLTPIPPYPHTPCPIRLTQYPESPSTSPHRTHPDLRPIQYPESPSTSLLTWSARLACHVTSSQV